MSAVADLDELTRMWAVEHYIGHWDGYSGTSGPNNYFLHSDADGPLQHAAVGHRPDLVDGAPRSTSGGGRLFVLVHARAGVPGPYRAALAVVRTRAGALDLEARADTLAAALAPWQLLDPRREQSLGDIAGAVSDVSAFLGARAGATSRSGCASEAPVDPPAPPAPPAGSPGAGVPARRPGARRLRLHCGVRRSTAPRRASLGVGITRVTRTTLTTTVRVPGRRGRHAAREHPRRLAHRVALRDAGDGTPRRDDRRSAAGSDALRSACAPRTSCAPT